MKRARTELRLDAPRALALAVATRAAQTVDLINEDDGPAKQ